MSPSAADGEVRRAWTGWINVVVAAVIMLATLPGRTQGLGLITEPMLRDLGLDRVTYANINLWATLLGAAICLPIGRVFDRVGLRGATFALIDPSYKVDAAAGQLTDGLTPADLGTPYPNHFPYLGVPFDGYHQPAH